MIQMIKIPTEIKFNYYVVLFDIQCGNCEEFRKCLVYHITQHIDFEIGNKNQIADVVFIISSNLTYMYIASGSVFDYS